MSTKNRPAFHKTDVKRTATICENEIRFFYDDGWEVIVDYVISCPRDKAAAFLGDNWEIW
jgi:hypothetical protein